MKKKIQSINPDWHPPTLAERILSFIAEKGKPTEADIFTEFKQTATKFMLKNILKKKADVLWLLKDGKYVPLEHVSERRHSVKS